VFAFVAMGQCMTGLVASVIFNNIYPHSLALWDGLCLLIAGLMNFFGIVLALIVFIHRRIHENDDEALNLISPDASTTMSSAIHSSAAPSSDEEEDEFKAQPPAYSSIEPDGKEAEGLTTSGASYGST